MSDSEEDSDGAEAEEKALPVAGTSASPKKRKAHDMSGSEVPQFTSLRPIHTPRQRQR